MLQKTIKRAGWLLRAAGSAAVPDRRAEVTFTTSIAKITDQYLSFMKQLHIDIDVGANSW